MEGSQRPAWKWSLRHCDHHCKPFREVSRLPSSEVRFFTEIGRLAFLRPPLGDLGATYDDHLRLIGKRVVDFLLALIQLFELS